MLRIFSSIVLSLQPPIVIISLKPLMADNFCGNRCKVGIKLCSLLATKHRLHYGSLMQRRCWMGVAECHNLTPRHREISRGSPILRLIHSSTRRLHVISNISRCMWVAKILPTTSRRTPLSATTTLGETALSQQWCTDPCKGRWLILASELIWGNAFNGTVALMPQYRMFSACP